MDPKQLKPQPGYFEQLALDLVVEEELLPPGNHPPSPEEARLRSEAARQLLEGEGPKQAWMEEYLQLRTAGWPWRVAAYIAWAASPRIGRAPSSIEELAKNVLGLTGPRQIHHWRETNPAIDEVVGVLQAAPLMAHRRDVLEALSRSAADSDHRSNPDRKLFLEITGDYTPKIKVEDNRGKTDDLAHLSEEELKQQERQLLALQKSRSEPTPEEASGE